MKNILLSTLCVVASIACGCQTVIDVPEELPVSFSASVQEMTKGEAEQTKGSLWNETGTTKKLSEYTDKFRVSVWNNKNGASAIPTGTVVSYSGGEWQTANKYFWVENVEKTVFAYANLPESGSSVLCNSKAKLQLSYNVPETADKQTDILLGAYVGKSVEGRADLHFGHPLTSIKFKAGTIAGGVTVNKLSLVKVAASGVITLNPDGTLSDWNVNKYDKTVTQSKNGGLGTSSIGEPFLLIPQDLTANPVRVVLELSDGNIVTSTLSTGKWLAGTTYTYTIDYDNPE